MGRPNVLDVSMIKTKHINMIFKNTSSTLAIRVLIFPISHWQNSELNELLAELSDCRHFKFQSFLLFLSEKRSFLHGVGLTFLRNGLGVMTVGPGTPYPVKCPLTRKKLVKFL